jgi:hypothetical protein
MGKRLVIISRLVPKEPVVAHLIKVEADVHVTKIHLLAISRQEKIK